VIPTDALLTFGMLKLTSRMAKGEYVKKGVKWPKLLIFFNPTRNVSQANRMS
jgi:hypothetical protein